MASCSAASFSGATSLNGRTRPSHHWENDLSSIAQRVRQIAGKEKLLLNLILRVDHVFILLLLTGSRGGPIAGRWSWTRAGRPGRPGSRPGALVHFLGQLVTHAVEILD